MNKITLLDCTLRDGGYINNWMFGSKESQRIVSLIQQSGVDYVEVGFIKLCDYNIDRILFSHMSQINQLFSKIRTKKYAAIVEVGYGYPVTEFPDCSDETVDLVRVIMWKRMLKEGLEYCKQLKSKGYEIAIQATRTEQYSDEEFVDFINMFNELKPKAVYIVDTFGLLNKNQLFRYASIADAHLDDGILLGYHAHNNMEQAFSNSVALIEGDWKHELMLDASVFGMGKGPGNLCLELIMKYLNDMNNTDYLLSPLYEVTDKYLMRFFRENPWGYSVPYFLSAINTRNPSYADYMAKKGISMIVMSKVFELMKERDVGITFDTEMCDKMIEEVSSVRL